MSESEYDGTDRLCDVLYGRKAKPRDYLGGSKATMLYDAALRIAKLTAENERLREEVSSYDAEDYNRQMHDQEQGDD